jgi:hemoglobin-like flavoprotein
VTLSAHTIAQQSYSRCQRTPDFFMRFYDVLLESHPAIPPMFENTDFPKQRKLLQHGLGLLLSFANKADEQLLERIAARHSASGLDVDPELYPCFVDSLVEVVRRSDPKFDDEIERAWREAVEPGIDFIRRRYAS